MRKSAGSADDEALAQLQRRVAELESEVQECRRLNRRLAEITDLLQEVLLPAAAQDREALDAAVERLQGSL
jgi:hypothetical protein